MEARTLKGEYAQMALKNFPNASEMSLARKLYSENPLVFPSLKSARNALRWYGGKDKNGQKASRKDPIKRDTPFSRENPYGLPPSDEAKWEPYIMPTTANNILILSDIHIPYHSISALNAAIKYGKENKVNAIILNGDIMDCYDISRFDKNPKSRKFAEELEMTSGFIKTLYKQIRAKIFYKIGNHEERWQRFLRTNAPQICDMEEFRLRVILNCDIMGVEMIEDKRIIRAGMLNILHGHEFGSVSSAVNPARTYYLKTKESTICGHLHQPSEHTEPNLSGKITTSFSTGCLCYDEETEVLTKDGFKIFPSITMEDSIAEYNVGTKKITYKTPIALQKFLFTGELLGFKSRRTDLLVTPEHKMLSTRGEGDILICSAQELMDRKKRLKNVISGYLDGEKNLYFGDDRDKLLSELLGFIITDGTYRAESAGIRIYQKNKYDTVKYLLETLNIPYSEGKSRDIPVFNIPAHWGKIIRGINPIKNEISRVLLNMDHTLLIHLYKGLISGDGHRKTTQSSNKTTDYFSTHNEAATIQFQELCHKIGYSARIQIFHGDKNNMVNRPHYIYKCFVRKFDVSDVKVKYKKPYSGFVYDISTTNGFFVVRRNSIITISGNCELHPEYARINRWAHGFAHARIHKDGTFSVRNMRIIDGKIV